MMFSIRSVILVLRVLISEHWKGYPVGSGRETMILVDVNVDIAMRKFSRLVTI